MSCASFVNARSFLLTSDADVHHYRYLSHLSKLGSRFQSLIFIHSVQTLGFSVAAQSAVLWISLYWTPKDYPACSCSHSRPILNAATCSAFKAPGEWACVRASVREWVSDPVPYMTIYGHIRVTWSGHPCGATWWWRDVLITWSRDRCLRGHAAVTFPPTSSPSRTGGD